jgi:hypothetical protein
MAPSHTLANYIIMTGGMTSMITDRNKACLPKSSDATFHEDICKKLFSVSVWTAGFILGSLKK